MFYQVRVLSPSGKVKAIISEEELSRVYWDKFLKSEDSYSMVNSNSRQVPSWVRQRLNVEFVDAPEKTGDQFCPFAPWRSPRPQPQHYPA